MTSMAPVHKDIFYPIFTKIRGLQRLELREFLRVKNVNNIFSNDYISQQRYEQLIEFTKLIDNSDFSSIKEYVEIDTEHSKEWLKVLNTYMLSREYQNDVSNKNRIIEQQKLIYKTVNQ